MLPIRSSSILEERYISPEELFAHQIYKENGIHYFSILKRRTILELRSTNEVLKDLPKKEFIEQIRTVFADFMKWCPPYKQIEDALEKHCENCPLVNHWFFEAEPVCTAEFIQSNATALFVGDLLDVYHYVGYRPKKIKIQLIKENLFNFIKVEMKNVKVDLSPPHFEYFIFALINFIHINGFAEILKTIHLDNFRLALSSHLKKCKGPCAVNIYGFPICLLSDNKAKKILRMMSCVQALHEAKKVKISELQETFDMIYNYKNYDNFLKFLHKSHGAEFRFRE